MKSILITLFILGLSLTISAQKSNEAQTYCNILTKLISYYSTIDNELSFTKALFNEEENPPCYMNAIQFSSEQTSL